MRKTIGILGGMGPLATADLFKKMIEMTDAHCDQEHVRVLIDNNTSIPDRSAAILRGGADPVPELIKSAQCLEKMGADVLIVPCNTSHYFLPRVQSSVSIPFINMPQKTVEEIKRRGIKKAALLATDGTVHSGVYKKFCDEAGIDMLLPDAKGQQIVMDVNYKGVKAGNYSMDMTDFHHVMDGLYDAGAEIMILGCTELPLAFEIFHIDRPAVDPTMCLAAAAVRYAGASVKKESGY